MSKGKTKEPSPPESRGPGRPLGSPNRDYGLAQAAPQRCFHCDGTVFGPRQTILRSREEKSGIANDGKPYTAKFRVKCQCLNPKCLRWNQIPVYEYVPEAIEEAGYDEPAPDDEECGT